MLRRAMLTLAITAVLLVGGGALAYALWSVTRPLPEVELSTGSFEVTADWVDEPDLTGLFPGDTAAGTATVTLQGQTDWRYSVDYEAEGALGGHLDVLWHPGGTLDAEGACTGNPLPMGEPHPEALEGGATSEFCIELTLSDRTPETRQGESIDIDVTVTAEQVLQ